MAAAAAIFDVDGTLVDSGRPGRARRAECLRALWPQGRIREIGKGGDRLMPVFLSQDELALRGKAVDDYRAEHWKRDFLNRVRPFAAVRELRQQRGLRVALASSANEDELAADRRPRPAQTSAVDAARKPHPDIRRDAAGGRGRP
jgi:beta-phosphoglucomutase-like phosphatase (HAD superfamily)